MHASHVGGRDHDVVPLLCTRRYYRVKVGLACRFVASTTYTAHIAHLHFMSAWLLAYDTIKGPARVRRRSGLVRREIVVSQQYVLYLGSTVRMAWRTAAC